MADKSKKALATVAGVLDPLLRKWAQRLAEKTPADSIFRSELVEGAIGALKGLLESFSDSMPAFASVSVEKITDFGDFFAGALGKAEDGGKVAVDKWMDKFFVDAGERLKKAKDKTLEAQHIHQEFVLRLAILDDIEAAVQKRREQAHEKTGGEPKTEKPGFVEFWKKKAEPWLAEKDLEIAGGVEKWMNKQRWLRP